MEDFERDRQLAEVSENLKKKGKTLLNISETYEEAPPRASWKSERPNF